MDAISAAVISFGCSKAIDGHAQPIACLERDGEELVAGESGRTEYTRLFVNDVRVAEVHAGTLLERGLDFARADEIFAGIHFTGEDARVDYQEKRLIRIGWLDKRLVVLVLDTTRRYPPHC